MTKRIIGITGGIGAGKTVVLELLKQHYNCQVIDADKVGHLLQQPDEMGYDMIVDAFGDEILVSPKQRGLSAIDRKALGDIVFSQSDRLIELNNIMHPLIHQRIKDIISHSECDIIAVEAAILTKTSLIELIDELWYIYADREIRIDRLQEHRNISRKKAESIMDKQPSDEEFKEVCDVCIDNSGSIEDTCAQIKKALDKCI